MLNYETGERRESISKLRLDCRHTENTVITYTGEIVTVLAPTAKEQEKSTMVMMTKLVEHCPLPWFFRIFSCRRCLLSSLGGPMVAVVIPLLCQGWMTISLITPESACLNGGVKKRKKKRKRKVKEREKKEKETIMTRDGWILTSSLSP